jgi:hypothetical protein
MSAIKLKMDIWISFVTGILCCNIANAARRMVLSVGTCCDIACAPGLAAHSYERIAAGAFDGFIPCLNPEDMAFREPFHPRTLLSMLAAVFYFQGK